MSSFSGWQVCALVVNLNIPVSTFVVGMEGGNATPMM